MVPSGAVTVPSTLRVCGCPFSFLPWARPAGTNTIRAAIKKRQNVRIRPLILVGCSTGDYGSDPRERSSPILVGFLFFLLDEVLVVFVLFLQLLGGLYLQRIGAHYLEVRAAL